MLEWKAEAKGAILRVVVMLLAIFCCMLCCHKPSVTAYAAEQAIEPNGDWVSGSTDSDIDYYWFSIPSAGKVSYTFQVKSGAGECSLYDTELSNYYSYIDCTGTPDDPKADSREVDLQAGKYCLKIRSRYGYAWTGSYQVKVSFTSADSNETEPNDSVETAMPIAEGELITGFLPVNEKLDFYKFEITQSSIVQIIWSPGESGADMVLRDSDYVTINGDSTYTYSGLKPGTYYIRVAPYSSYYQKTGSYTLKYVLKDIPAEKRILTLSTGEMSAKANGEINNSSEVTVSTDGTGGFQANCDVDWIKIGQNGEQVSSLTLEDGSSLSVYVGPNSTESSRTGTVTFTHQDGETKAVLTVRQQKVELVVNITEITVNAKGVLSENYISVDTKGTGNFSVQSDADWLHIGKYRDEKESALTFDNGRSGFYVSADKSEADTDRTGIITIQHEAGKIVQVTVKQGSLIPILEVDYTEKVAEKNGRFYNSSVTVKTQKTGSYTVEVVDANWLGIASRMTTDISLGLSKMSFDDGDKFYLVASENTGKERTAKVKVTHSSGHPSKEITVTQRGNNSGAVELDRERINFDDGKAAFSDAVNILADDDTQWTVKTSANWIKVVENSKYGRKYTSLEGKGSKTLYIYVNENVKLAGRYGKVTISSSVLEEDLTVVIYQDGREENPATLLAELSVGVSKKTFNKGKTSKIRFSYPEGLYASDVKKITYKSSKKKVATVNSKGVIKGIRKGQATITVKVTLDSGDTRTFKLKIKVGARTVSVTQKK